jgi:hypothetical protein
LLKANFYGLTALPCFPPQERMGISKHELVAMLEEEELKDAALVVFANKQARAAAPARGRLCSWGGEPLRLRAQREIVHVVAG